MVNIAVTFTLDTAVDSKAQTFMDVLFSKRARNHSQHSYWQKRLNKHFENPAENFHVRFFAYLLSAQNLVACIRTGVF